MKLAGWLWTNQLTFTNFSEKDGCSLSFLMLFSSGRPASMQPQQLDEKSVNFHLRTVSYQHKYRSHTMKEGRREGSKQSERAVDTTAGRGD